MKFPFRSKNVEIALNSTFPLILIFSNIEIDKGLNGSNNLFDTRFCEDISKNGQKPWLSHIQLQNWNSYWIKKIVMAKKSGSRFKALLGVYYLPSHTPTDNCLSETALVVKIAHSIQVIQNIKSFKCSYETTFMKWYNVSYC